MEYHKTVPLVVYVGGERIVIGEARVSEGGHVDATINEVGGNGFDPHQIFDFNIGNFSIAKLDELTVGEDMQTRFPISSPMKHHIPGLNESVLPEFPIKYPEKDA